MNIAIYTNILTPYRTFFYDALYKECQKNGDNFHVILMADTEPNRNWRYNDFKTEYSILLNNKTVTVGNAYIHFNNNLKAVLIELKLDVIICAGSYLCPGILNVLSWKKQFGYTTYYWSESHLNEIRSYNSIKIKIRESIRKYLYRRFDGFWYAGQMSLQFIKKYAKADCRLYFMPNLVEEDKYERASHITEIERKELREKYNIDNSKTVFICPARLSVVKGIDKFISLFAKCPNRDKATVLIAGDGELKDSIEEQIKKLNVDIRLLGFQNQGSIVELYGLSDVFLLPSLSDPNPLTCIEALWAGLPLFISEHCGNYPEVVQKGKNGYVFSYEEEDRTIKDLNMMINASDNWKTNASQISKEIAEEKYSSKKVVKRVIEYYHS